MKKLLIITGIFSPEIGGPASYAQIIGKKLAQAHGVTVITYSSVWSDQGDKSLPFAVVRIWKKWPWPVRHAIYAIKVFFAAKNHDLIFALNAINAGPTALVASRFFKKKYIVKIVGDRAWETAIQSGKTNLLINDFQKEPRRGWIGIIHRIQIWVCGHAARIIVPSIYLSEIVRGWGVSKDAITVIYNGVEFEPSPLSKEEARKQIGISGNIIVSAGRMVPWKGFRMLIKIMPQLLRVNQFFRLVIIGDGPEFQILQAMVKNLGLDRKVYLVGKKRSEELATYLAAADLFVLNTGYEGFSHQLLEVMAARVPIITTAVGGNREIIQQGENGFLVKYNDEFNLIEAIKTLWAMPDIREKFVEEGSNTLRKLNVTKMENETTALLISNL
ncbi:MAG: glycosyltransferase family 4 protein [Patescibacteria group bacterium]